MQKFFLIILMLVSISPLMADRILEKKDQLRNERGVYWKISGIEDGSYYVRMNYFAGSNEHFLEMPLYLNGLRVNFSTYSLPDDAFFVTSQTASPVRIANGDTLTLPPKGNRVRSVTLSKTKDDSISLLMPYVNVKLEERVFSMEEIRFNEQFEFKITDLTMRPRNIDIAIRIVDFYGETVGEKVYPQAAINDVLTFACDYKKGTSDSYRAIVDVKDGSYSTQYVFQTLRNYAGPFQKTMHLNDDWEYYHVKDKGTVETRTLQTYPPVGATWKKTVLPSPVHEYVCWFRRQITVPPELKGERYFLRFRRLSWEADLYLNGKKIHEHRINTGSVPFDVEITKWLDDGKTNRLEICARGRIAGINQKGILAKNLRLTENKIVENCRDAGFSELLLLAAPKVCVKDVAVTTSFRKKTLTVSAEVPKGYSLSNRVLYQGKEVLSFKGKSGVWHNPIFWGPEKFPLLKLETRLINKEGKMVDLRETRFGFREIWADGPNLMWNGKSVRLLSRALDNPWWRFFLNKNYRNELRQRARIMKKQKCISYRHIYSDSIHPEILDEEGILVAYSSVLPFAPEEYKLTENRYWENNTSNNLQMIRSLMNHPSIFTWYVSNEFFGFSYDRNFKRLQPMVRALRAADPTRFVEAGCDLDLRGETEIISTHYPLDFTVYRRPDTYMPEMLYWRYFKDTFHIGDPVPKGQDGQVCNVVGQRQIRWGTKPIIINETGYVVMESGPFRMSRIFGEKPYENYGACEQIHMEQMRLNAEGQRDAEAVVITPWLAPAEDKPSDFYLPPVNVVILQKYNKFYTGTTVDYDINIFHDAFANETLEFYWNLEKDGKTVRSGSSMFHADFSATLRKKICVELKKSGNYMLKAGVKGRVEKCLPIRVYDRFPVKSGLIVTADDDMNAMKNVIMKTLKSGENVLVSPRQSYPQWLPLSLSRTGRVPSINFSFRKDHPVMKNIDDGELKYWYPDHRTGNDYFRKTGMGNIRTLIEAGGPDGLVYAGLVEIPMENASLYLSRMELDPDKNPVAAKLLNNIFTRRNAESFATAGVLADPGSAFVKFCKKLGVQYQPATIENIGNFKVLLIDGNRKFTKNELKEISLFPGRKFIHHAGEEFGIELNANIAESFAGRAISPDRKAWIMRGITNHDLFWRLNQNHQNTKKIFSDKRYFLAPLADASIRGKNITPLCFPAVMAERGNTVFSRINFLLNHPVLEERIACLFTTLMTNMGVKVLPPTRKIPEGLIYKPLDLSNLLDHPFRDDVAYDGKGGWSDQGNNDARHFTAKPGIHKFNGSVPFRIRQPNGCIALSSSYSPLGHDSFEVPVNASLDYLFLLHTSAWTSRQHHYSVFVDYADGNSLEIKMIGGVNMRDATSREMQAPFLDEETWTQTVLVIKNDAFGTMGIWSTAWNNPFPEKTVKKLRFVSKKKGVPFIFALTTGHLANHAKGSGGYSKEAYARLTAKALRLETEKKYPEAVAAYEQALKMNPANLEPYRGIARIYEMQNDLQKALETYQRSFDADFNQPDIVHRLEELKRLLKQ